MKCCFVPVDYTVDWELACFPANLRLLEQYLWDGGEKSFKWTAAVAAAMKWPFFSLPKKSIKFQLTFPVGLNINAE